MVVLGMLWILVLADDAEGSGTPYPVMSAAMESLFSTTSS